MNRNLWRQSFANELDKQERRQSSNIRRYLSTSYNTAIDQAVESGGIQPLDSLFEIHEIRNLYIDLYRTVGVNFAKWYETAYKKLIKKSTGNTTTWATAFAEVGEREAGRKVKIVQGTAKDNLRKVLGQLFKDEDFQNQGKIVQSRILRNRFNEISAYQAERIARTETTNAANQGVLRGATDLFGKNNLQKEWIANNDPRTRDSHISIDGTIVDYNEPFKVPSGFGIDLMNHPADPAGSAANVINCRCSIAVIPKEDAEIREGVELEGFGGALSARTTQLIGDELVSAAKPAKEVAEETVEYKHKPKNWEEISGGKVKDDRYLAYMNKDIGFRKAVGDEGSYWWSYTNEVVIDIKRHIDTRASVIAHEFAHVLSFQRNWIGRRATSINPKIKDLISKQSKEIGIKRGKLSDEAKKLVDKWGGMGSDPLGRSIKLRKHLEWRKTQRSKFPDISDEQYEEYMSAVADWLGSLSTNEIGFGHKITYMKKPVHRADEFIAHSFENRFVGNPVFEYYFPNQYKQTIDLVNELLKDLDNVN